jgi:1-acyl-sn-glycerol-3-phosphate acyltransferase
MHQAYGAGVTGPRAKLTRRWFAWYAPWTLRRHFHRVMLIGERPTFGEPIVLACQHVSFWDGILLDVALRQLGGGRLRCIVDAQQMRRHPFFAHIGGVAVPRDDARQAARVLRQQADQAGEKWDTMVVFPQGRLRPADARPLGFEPAGLRRLATNAKVVPAALRYDFWEEQRPEALLAIGEPVPVDDVEPAVAALADKLFAASLQREPGEILLHGRRGVGVWKEWPGVQRVMR